MYVVINLYYCNLCRGFKRVAGQKVPTNTIAYYNKHFLRGKPKLLKNMNGGKTKFVSAREKRMRAQLKRERDREQAVLAATQQQSSLFNRAGVAGAVDPLAGLMGGVGPGAASLFGGGGAAGLLGGAGAGNPSHLQALLASRQMLLQRQAEEMRIAEHVLAAELSAQKQREELMRLYGQQGGQGGAAMGALPGSGGASSASAGAMGNLGVEQLLAARQQMATGNGTGNLIDRLLAERMANSNSGHDGAAALMRHQQQQQQQRSEEQGSSHSSRQGAKDDSSHHSESKESPPPPAGVTGTNANGQIDPDLFKLFLLEQERKRRGL